MPKLPEMTVYYNQTMDITLEVPVGWAGKVLAPLAFRIFSLPEPQFNNYRATLSVEEVNLNENTDGKDASYGSDTLDELIAQAQADLKKEMHGFQSLREKKFTSQDGLPAYALWFNWQDPATGQVHSQIQAFMLTANGYLYLFNAATLKPLETQHFPIFDHVILSARISK
jgi:hypothetical protein